MPELPEELVLPEGFVPAELPDPPAVPRDAATVMLVRDGAPGLEVFLLRRVLGMAFAGGMTVFPGGGVDKRDADTSIRWHGEPPAWWADRFSCDEALARALVCAAVRETFEESGVLLAGTDGTSVVSDTRPFHAARQDLVDREYSFAEFLAEHGLVLRADLLRPWANWVTPAAEPRRYDTRFFLAAVPPGQTPDGATTEADEATWQTPASALAAWKSGDRLLLPPTWVTLTELDEAATVATAMAAPRTIAKITPKLVHDGTHHRVVLTD
ncbi:NUDIX hydrolase [Actinokineospora globicatena]|uniref:NUDIX hydrolase n=1 Tax=Actinokineospora globicatena TaxID=103729 RepID=A0A9W6QSP7_9PSEU|nr:NUDIX hydrolase [Actinokineospora globicatena]